MWIKFTIPVSNMISKEKVIEESFIEEGKCNIQTSSVCCSVLLVPYACRFPHERPVRQLEVHVLEGLISIMKQYYRKVKRNCLYCMKCNGKRRSTVLKYNIFIDL